MREIVLADGGKYDLNGLKGLMRNFGELYLLDPLGKGNLSLFFAYKGKGLFNLGDLIEKVKEQKLDSSEKTWLQNLVSLQDRLDSFSENLYRSLDTDSKSKYTTQYALECAEILESLVMGHISKSDKFCPACPNAKKDATWEKWNKFISPINYLNLCSKILFAKNEQGIKIPLGLNIVKDKEEGQNKD